MLKYVDADVILGHIPQTLIDEKLYTDAIKQFKNLKNLIAYFLLQS